MATQTATSNSPKQDLAVEQKIQQLRQLYADTPQFAKTALENTLKDLASAASQPRSRMESAGRTGSRQGKVSELTVIAPFAPGGAARLRALLQLRNGNYDDTDRVGTVHDMRFVFLDNDTKLLFATAYDGDWDVYIEDFVAKIPNEMDVLFSCFEGWPGIHNPKVKDYIAKHQITAEGWYVANPNLTWRRPEGSSASARRLRNFSTRLDSGAANRSLGVRPEWTRTYEGMRPCCPQRNPSVGILRRARRRSTCKRSRRRSSGPGRRRTSALTCSCASTMLKRVAHFSAG